MLGRKIIQIECVDSTNNYAANLISDGKIEHGAVILAEEQTNGRGQRGAQWLSKPGENLIFSLFVEPVNLSVNEQFLLTQFASVSVVNTLRKIGLEAVIKWPNDVLINHKKIAGILIENQLKGNNVGSSVIGIGLNVNQEDFGALNATSIRLETGNHFSVREFVFSMLNEMNIVWEHINFKDIETLKEKYLEHLWRLNQPAKYEDAEGEFEGIIRGTEENGSLKIERKNKITHYNLKEITFK